MPDIEIRTTWWGDQANEPVSSGYELGNERSGSVWEKRQVIKCQTFHNRIVNTHTFQLFCRELELSPVPGRRGVGQTGKDVPYPGSCVPVLQPA